MPDPDLDPICYMVQIEDGTIYSPIGGGYADLA
jgi:hypothetical protein